eukprot:gene20791-23615_t
MEDNAKIRNHTNRAGDADTANEYEHVKKGDDESIDDDGSEVGWDSEDEQVFHSTSVYQKKKGSKRSEPESDDEDYDEDMEQEGGILLSDILFKNIEAKAKGIVLPNDQDSDDDDDDDEEDDEEEDEEDDDNEDGSDDASGSEGSDDDIDEVHTRLLDAIDRFSKPQSSSSAEASSKKRSSNQNAAESAYSSVLNNGDVSMNALLGALDDTRGLGVVKKHLADLEKGLAAPVHVEKVVADRMERTQVYAGSKEEMNKWQGTVVANRHVGTLDLAKDKRQVRSFKSMLNRFEPTTDMEKEIQMVLVKHGANDQDAAQREVDELQGRNMSLQEIREKQAELAKVKALMFYEQMKRHRLNKIKSKAYRKIQKKKKLKKGETAADDLDEEEGGDKKEKDAYNRVKERMDLRHKNTSKWARMAIQYGHTDKSLRDAYHESVQLGQELTHKMNEELQDDAHSAGSASEGEDGSDNEDKTSRREVSNRASRAIASLLSENLASSSAGESVVPEGRYKKLFEMDFMKRAAEQQKEKARADAQSILREIEGMEEEYDSDLGEIEAAERAQKGPQISQERLAQAKQEVKSMLGGGALGALGRRKGAVHTNSINLDAKAASSSASPFEFEYGEEEHSDAEEHAAMEQSLEDNPWLQPVASLSGGSKKRKSSGTGAKSAANEHEEVFINTLEMQGKAAPAGKKAKGGANAGNSASSSSGATSSSSASAVSNEPQSKKGKKNGPSGVIVEAAKDGATGDNKEKKEKPVVKIALSEGHTQADLVQMAFAGPDLEAEFAAFKKSEIDNELGIDEKKMKILSDVKAGWGDWAGPGAGGMAISKKTLDKRDRLLTKVQGEHASKVL